MISPRKRAVFVVIDAEDDERLRKLKAVDGVLYSASRVIKQCVKRTLHEIEEEAGLFPVPTKQTSGRKTRQRAA
jgi:hypothetical protein